MMTDETDIPVETPLPILPEPIDAGIILGIVLTIIGGVIWLLTCYIILTRSPRKKECYFLIPPFFTSGSTSGRVKLTLKDSYMENYSMCYACSSNFIILDGISIIYFIHFW